MSHRVEGDLTLIPTLLTRQWAALKHWEPQVFSLGNDGSSEKKQVISLRKGRWLYSWSPSLWEAKTGKAEDPRVQLVDSHLFLLFSLPVSPLPYTSLTMSRAHKMRTPLLQFLQRMKLLSLPSWEAGGGSRLAAWKEGAADLSFLFTDFEQSPLLRAVPALRLLHCLVLPTT